MQRANSYYPSSSQESGRKREREGKAKHHAFCFLPSARWFSAGRRLSLSRLHLSSRASAQVAAAAAATDHAVLALYASPPPSEDEIPRETASRLLYILLLEARRAPLRPEARSRTLIIT